MGIGGLKARSNDGSPPASIEKNRHTRSRNDAGDTKSDVSDFDLEILREDGKVLLRFCPPRCTTVADVLIVLFYHMLPFTPVPIVLLALLIRHMQRAYGWVGPAILCAVLVLLTLLPLRYSRKFRASMQTLVYLSQARYMEDVRVVVPGKPVRGMGTPHMFIVHPHGRMFYTPSMLIQFHDKWRAPFLADAGDLFGCAASGFFAVPLLRHLLYAVGAMPADRGSILRRLRQKHHVAIFVGGVKEVCLGTSSLQDEIYLKNRKGFARIAVEEKVGVVPVYCFNENQLFQHDPKWFLKLWEFVNRYVNVGVPFMRGVLSLPMPYRRELLIVMGEPLYPKDGESADAFHERYIWELQSLFERYVGLSPHPKHKLVIR